MKILFLVAHLNSGGSERTVTYLSAFMAQNKNDVHVLSLSDDKFYELDEKVTYTSLSISSRSSSIIKRVMNIIRRYVGVEAYINSFRPDLVVCLLPEMAKYVLRKHKNGAFKLVTSERANPQFIENAKILQQRKKIYLVSDGVIFQTKRAMDFYDESIKCNGVVIPNAIGNELVYQINASREKKDIVAIGRLTAQKDYETLLRAFALVHKRFPEHTLSIFGEGPDRTQLENRIKDLQLDGIVLLKGAQRDALKQASKSSCYVMTSKYEGMPNALMEAMAIGLPCVSTDCPFGPAELISDGINGILVPVGDADTIAKAICRIISDEELANTLSKNSVLLREQYSVDIVSSIFLDYFKRIIERG